jgi:cell fate regulator YaaT (PSP1 superfamily)
MRHRDDPPDMPIVPLPVFEADADPHHRTALSDAEVYARLRPPDTIVVRFGAMKLIGEYPYDGDAKPGCGTKLVARTHRGTELAEMLTTTCENAGCAKSVTRLEMREYIENSGGSEYPFHTEGRIVRIATIEDLNKQSQITSTARDYVVACKALIAELGLAMKLVEAEPILGGELLTFYYMAEERVDFRELVRRLASQFKTRIEMRQVGARDEARLVADYERCGQHCCCKNFLKVLKPVSMKSAKVQKATLDPLKISGRCGRLMCCLRYEDQTYTELKARLPRRNARVGTAQGPGLVIDSKILVQLVLVKLEGDDREIAVPVEELMDPEACPKPGTKEWEESRKRLDDPLRGLSAEDVVGERFGQEPEEATAGTDGAGEGGRRGRERGRRRRRARHEQQDAYREQAKREEAQPDRATERRERGRRRGAPPREAPPQSPGGADGPPPTDVTQTPGSAGERDAPEARRKRRSRRRRPRKRRDGGGPPPSGPPSPPAPES